jgi:hypothetical protein
MPRLHKKLKSDPESPCDLMTEPDVANHFLIDD